MVGATGFEPVTPALSRQCSTAELRTLFILRLLFYYIKLSIIVFYNCYNMLKFRSIKNTDIQETLGIYNYYIENSLSNFEEKKLSLEEFRNIVNDILILKLPFIICEKNKKIIGLAYLNKFRTKSGYRYAFENTIYVHESFLSQGIGNKLLKKLINKSLENDNIKSIIAVIGNVDSKASINIHKKNEFKIIGTLKNVGFKKNQWIDSIYMQRILK
jgi:L-amino acid N-acyltransferase YncA